MQWKNENRYAINVLAAGRKTRTLREAYSDSDGNFCLRYLPPDDYTVFAHEYDAGWRRLPEAAVDNSTRDVGVHPLLPGGARLPARFRPHLRWELEVAVVATDSNGISIRNPDLNEYPPDEFKISGLWPGKWIVALRKGERVLSTKTIELRGVETISCDLLEKIALTAEKSGRNRIHGIRDLHIDPNCTEAW